MGRVWTYMLYYALIQVCKAMSSVVGSVFGYAVGGGIALMPSAQFDNIVSFTVQHVGS